MGDGIMAAHDPADVPRKGQYIPTVTYIDSEGGGGLDFTTATCPECHALVDDAFMNEHSATHELAPPPEGGPKTA
jgi:hypothetical protein